MKLEVEGADGVEARIAVTDNGPGIEPEQLTRIFSPYARGETHGQAGNGLGLYIARQSADCSKPSSGRNPRSARAARSFLEIPRNK